MLFGYSTHNCELSAFLTCQVSSPQECFDEEREAGGGSGGVVGGRT
jgi:hypothetical protein